MPHRSLKAGEYRIEAHASMKSVMDLLQSGKSILYSLTFPEGLTVKEMFALLAADPVLSGPMPENLPPEGSLMPDTYSFTRGTNRQQIIDKMEAAEKRAVDRIWQGRDPATAVGTKEEMVVLASIVEKETGKADERPRVASVFINRLRKGMRLQSDPTVIYGLFGGDGKPPGRPLYQSDLDKKTPYNTYADNRPAADADLQSRARIAGGGRQSVEDEGSLFRGGRHGRSCILDQSQGAQRQCAALAGDRGRAQERRRPVAGQRGKERELRGEGGGGNDSAIDDRLRPGRGRLGR